MSRSLYKFSKEEINRINKICSKLENTVNQLDVINWLGNFKEDEWEKALLVSERIKYFTKPAIISELDIFLSKILNKYRGKIINISFLGEFGKSGSHLIYYIKKTPTYKNNISDFKILQHLKKIHTTIKNDGILLLIDDFIGTGESVTKFFNYEIKQQLVSKKIKIKTILLCVAYMEDAKNLIEKNIPDYEIVGTPYRKAFSNLGSVFGYRKRMIVIREFCFDYGQHLFSTFDERTRVTTKHPLGYGDSQSLIIFNHSTPNNSLPIIWSNKNSWTPLFIRSTENAISKYRDFRQSTIHWMTIALELKIISDISQFKSVYFRDINYRILALTRLKMKNISEPIICQILNITLNELDGIYNEGVIMGYFNENKAITQMGRKNYNSILGALRKNKKNKKDSLDLEEQKIYIPKQFLGRS
ncbi:MULTISPECIES: hypothetical protein [Chryseobacterium]|uniref:Phosphoribosyl transferase-like protein n=1 Tax=Chryseobacterium geocarposphaerae TaxID=1416776 RepID=A0ABU1LHD0_9FLAO|nr:MULTISPECIES: hypothetical protein [Chryseobacterium]MDR6406119.1 hypothetical protein [Chryseobacterium geocarposphaerae]MDR6699407.1 hypothetical protein [Chryseobacterium ginsenosidimutans]